jgi:hypothetical protein
MAKAKGAELPMPTRFVDMARRSVNVSAAVTGTVLLTAALFGTLPSATSGSATGGTDPGLSETVSVEFSVPADSSR